jgi:hypothetical protein
MKIAALTLSTALFILLSFALLHNPSSARSDAMPAPPVPSVSPGTTAATGATAGIKENLPVQHVGAGENQPL